jgi:zinc transport system substrate-binding protein
MKATALFTAAVVAASGLAFAAQTASGENPTAEKPRVKIVATTFPVFDWTREVLGERLAETDLVMLQQSGVDLHSYSPSAADLRKIAACDLFVFVGGESDEWTERALAQKANPGRRVLSLVKALGASAKEEKIVEGMEHEHHHHEAGHDEDHDKDHNEGHDEDHDEDEHEIDEHVWLSLRNAATLVKAIAAELAGIDPANAATYSANAAAYCRRLADLDGAYAAAVAAAKRRTLLVADRFPFRYLADDYGLDYFAAFAGCSAESEASFKTVAFLAKKVDELSLPVILTMEGAQHKIAETVRRTTKSKDQRILTLDSLQSTGGDAAAKTHYLDVMARNLKTLKEALN